MQHLCSRRMGVWSVCTPADYSCSWLMPAMPHTSSILCWCLWRHVFLAFQPHGQSYSLSLCSIEKPIAISHNFNRAVWFGHFPKPLHWQLQDRHTYQRNKNPHTLFLKGTKSPSTSLWADQHYLDLPRTCLLVLSSVVGVENKYFLSETKKSIIFFIEISGWWLVEHSQRLREHQFSSLQRLNFYFLPSVTVHWCLGRNCSCVGTSKGEGKREWIIICVMQTNTASR